MPETIAGMERLVNETFREFDKFDLNPYGGNPVSEGISQYLFVHRHEFIQTLVDIVSFTEQVNCAQVLEIGAFFGVVCVCLAKLGFKVWAADLPEYMSMPEQQERYGRYGITTAGVRLEDYLLPFETEQFDLVIMCEVLEHLNFNPLPLIKEINRVGRPNSRLYLSVPNLAQHRKRIRLLLGKSIHDPIQGFFDQLDPNALEIVNGHWREYVGTEIRYLLEKMGYQIDRHYYFSRVQTLKKPTLRNRLTRTVFRFVPSFKENQRVIAVRKERTATVFQIPRTVHPTLESL